MKKQKVQIMHTKLSFIKDINVGYNSLQGGDLKSYQQIYITFYVENSDESSDEFFTGDTEDKIALRTLFTKERKTIQHQFRFHPLDVMHLLFLTDSHFCFVNMHVPKDPYKTPFKTEYRDLDGQLVIEVDDTSKYTDALEKLKERVANELEEAKKEREKEYKKADEKEKEVIDRWAHLLKH
jgi:hypothetical protein